MTPSGTQLNQKELDIKKAAIHGSSGLVSKITIFNNYEMFRTHKKMGRGKFGVKKLCVVRPSDVILWDQSSGEGADRGVPWVP